MNYQKKYLKYKEKYLQLKNDEKNIQQSGSGTSSFEKGNILVSISTLNQWSLDFDGNEKRIKQGIDIAIENNSKLILFPELAVCGYSCQDHFIERETHELSFGVISNLLSYSSGKQILIAVGCPIIHNDVRYNTLIFIYNGLIVLIRPKLNLADDGNYREARWFTPWPINKFETFNYIGIDGVKKSAPIGIGIINCNDVLIAAEVCEELWVPDNIGNKLYLNGVDILLNPSGSHFESGKLQKRMNLIKNTTKRCGGAYLYANLEGCDGERLFFDGRSMIGLNGDIIEMEDEFTLQDVQVINASISLSSILSHRMKSNSYETQAANQERFKVINLDFDINDIIKPIVVPKISKKSDPVDAVLSMSTTKKQIFGGTHYKDSITREFKISDDEIQEIVNAASAWLWDYLRRSGAMGFMLPLSGGADSAVTATIVYNMCVLLDKAYKEENKAGSNIRNKNATDFINRFFTIAEVKGDPSKGIATSSEKIPTSAEITPQFLCHRILNTVYLPAGTSGVDDGTLGDIPAEMPTDEVIKGFVANPDPAVKIQTGWLARNLSERFYGANHKVVSIQEMFQSGITAINPITGLDYVGMRKEVDDGRKSDNKSKWDLLYQNIQARLRMINTYLLSQAIPESGSIYKNKSFLLVLGSSNADEILVGYYTKYDASAADINPIGSLSKEYINKVLELYSGPKWNIIPLRYIRLSDPTAELVADVVRDGAKVVQTDETDMGITYRQIYELGKLRADGLGPIDSYNKIMKNSILKDIFSVDPNKQAIEPKMVIQRIYSRYFINRNKTTIIPPSVHLLPSPDDNRYDLRPFLSPPFAKWNPVTKKNDGESVALQSKIIKNL